MSGNAGKGMVGGGAGRGMLGGGPEDEALFGRVAGAIADGGVGRGRSGGGMGGGKLIAAILRLGTTTGCCTGCPFDAKTMGLDVRLPGTNEGVEATARTGRVAAGRCAGFGRI